MERLTGRNSDGGAFYKNCFREDKCRQQTTREKCVFCKHEYSYCEKLAEYEDAEEQGLMAQNPYKPGELIFCVEEYVDGYDYSGYIFVASCNDFVISSSSYIHCNSFDEQLMEMCEESQEECGVSFYMFRKDRVFATKEEAEAALAEMNKKENINE